MGLNKDALAVNQDLLGRMAFRFRVDDETAVQLWRKELVGGAVAVAISNMNDTTAVPAGFAFNLRDAGFSPDTHVAVKNLYSGEEFCCQQNTFKIRSQIPPHGVQFLRLSYAPVAYKPLRGESLEI